MSSCPLIQEVSLNKCPGLKTVRVKNHNRSLKSFEFRGVWCQDSKIEIADVSSIETIHIKRCTDWFEHHYHHIFTHLKSLRLSSFEMSSKSVYISSSNFPCLEELELGDSLGAFEEFQLSSPSIKRLAIDVTYTTVSISINAPNILKFEYQGEDFPPHISFTTTSKKWKSDIVLKTDLDQESMALSLWLQKLDEFLKVFSQSETFVHVRVQRDDDECRFLGDPYSPTEEIVQHLDLCLGSLCSDFSVWLEVEGEPTVEWDS